MVERVAAHAVAAAEMRRRPPPRGRRSALRHHRVRAAWACLLPMLLVLAAAAGWPLLRTVWFGFTDASLTHIAEARWIGLANYLQWVDYGDGDGEWLGLLADADWWRAVRNTLVFTLVSVSVEAVLGLAIALVLNEAFRGRGLVRAAILIPWAIPTIVSAQMWAWMMHDQFGILNHIALGLGVIARPVAWTASPETAMAAVLIVDIWKTTPFVALLMLAALQMLPQDIYEAARVDGVSPVKRFFFITLPLIRPALMVAIIFRGLDALRIFDLIYVLTPSSPETKSMSVYAREQLFDFDNFGYGSAASTLLFLIIAFVTIVYIKAGRLNLAEGGR